MVPILLFIMIMFDLFPFWLLYSCILVDFMLVVASFFACAGIHSRGLWGLWPAEAREREYQLFFDISVGLQVGSHNPLLIYN